MADVDSQCQDGEFLSCVDPIVPAFLVFIRPSGEDGLSFPLTKSETILGQERPDDATMIDINLPADLTSGRHAKVVCGDGRFYLENLSQTTGTFVKACDGDRINLEDQILAGQVKFRVVVQRD